ncbi:hypothetical protein SGPA1_60113 [Streptomyces misionensis JCM 4497]
MWEDTSRPCNPTSCPAPQGQALMPNGQPNPVPYMGLEFAPTRFLAAPAAPPAIAITRPDGRYTAGEPFTHRHGNRGGGTEISTCRRWCARGSPLTRLRGAWCLLDQTISGNHSGARPAKRIRP